MADDNDASPKSAGIFAKNVGQVIVKNGTIRGFESAVHAENVGAVNTENLNASGPQLSNHKPSTPRKQWYEKPVGIVLLGVTIIIVATAITLLVRQLIPDLGV